MLPEDFRFHQFNLILGPEKNLRGSLTIRFVLFETVARLVWWLTWRQIQSAIKVPIDDDIWHSAFARVFAFGI